MANEQNLPLLKLEAGQSNPRKVGKSLYFEKPTTYEASYQHQKFSSKFKRLGEVISGSGAGITLGATVNEVSPERLLVFELNTNVSTFEKAAARIPNFNLISEEEFDSIEDGSKYVYALWSDANAMTQFLQLWEKYVNGEKQERGFTAFSELFSHLLDVRFWSAKDRLSQNTKSAIESSIFGKQDFDLLQIEIEVVFGISEYETNQLRKKIFQVGGGIISEFKLEQIQYHGILISIPISEIKRILEFDESSIIGSNAIIHVTAQSFASSILLEESDADFIELPAPTGSPILALLDGVPISNHAQIQNKLIVDDIFELEAETTVEQRIHGTAMASLITCGDLKSGATELNKKIHVIPVLGSGEQFPKNRLILDVIYNSLLSMVGENDPTAPEVLIVNLSLGDKNRVFDGYRVSSWARLLDKFASQYGILFIISAGNSSEYLNINGFTFEQLRNSTPEIKRQVSLSAVTSDLTNRRLLSPSESINGIAVGAHNSAISQVDFTKHWNLSDPYPDLRMPNPTSSVGLGYSKSIKPDILFPGGVESIQNSNENFKSQVTYKQFGLHAAAPPNNGKENSIGITGNTSGASALASRTCHKIYDALEEYYGARFLELSKHQKSLVLKSLLIHTAQWPTESADFIKSILGPLDSKQWYAQRENIHKFLGYGVADPELAISCTNDRATFWATDFLGVEEQKTVRVPIPVCIASKLDERWIKATIAWFSPVNSGRKFYRNAKLTLMHENEFESLGVEKVSEQPDDKQSSKGTVYSQFWKGQSAVAFGENHFIEIKIQREPDKIKSKDSIPFGLALTIAMPGQIQLYEQAKAMIEIAPRVII